MLWSIILGVLFIIILLKIIILREGREQGDGKRVVTLLDAPAAQHIRNHLRAIRLAVRIASRQRTLHLIEHLAELAALEVIIVEDEEDLSFPQLLETAHSLPLLWPYALSRPSVRTLCGVP
jgi:hypothetical protein